MHSQRSSTRAYAHVHTHTHIRIHTHTHIHTNLVRVCMPVLGCVCIELGVSGKPRDWESRMASLSLGRGSKDSVFRCADWEKLRL